ncbi:TetR/AcrR family transcriptional regulator [Glaciihabitans sp. UYNi722]|uniref:TetR/AcrR family transcriptional regulator n=1 Tax=Glaciihabitans sp. UYNi722 TaxID=3156344 RepID=UPI003390EA22
MSVPIGMAPRSVLKRQAILDAAEDVFLRSGYLGTNMDELAALSGVSKQTVYKHFGSKEALFVELVMSMTNIASDTVHHEIPDPADDAELTAYLVDYAERQLAIVLTPRLLQLRRLVIGEVSRFPALATALWESGPSRAMSALALVFGRLAEAGLLEIDDARVAASTYNWLVMSGPLNEAMLLGDAAVPSTAQLHHHAAEGVRVFLAGYGR